MPGDGINVGTAFSGGVNVLGCKTGVCIPDLGTFNEELLENVSNTADTLTMDLGFHGKMESAYGA